MKARIKRLEGQLNAEKRKTAKLEKALKRAHYNLEVERTKLYGSKLEQNRKREEFVLRQDELIKGAW